MKTDILEEIIQSEKQHKTDKLLKALVLIIASIGIVAVIIAIGMSLFNNHKTNKSYMEATQLFQGLSQLSQNNQLNPEKASENFKKAVDILENIAKNDSTYGAIASFYLASLSALQNDPSQNIFQYQRIADNKNYDNIFRDYAIISEMMSRLMLNKIEPEKAVIKLNDIAQNKDRRSPFHLSSLMLQTGLYASKGDKENSLTTINKIISDTKVTNNMKVIANGMKQYIESPAFTEAVKSTSK